MPRSSSPFLESISRHMLAKRYSKRTIETYLYWIRSFINFHKKRHPTDMGAVEIETFLTFLAVERKVSAATQGLVLNALAFLYNRFLEKPMGNVGNFRRSSIQAKLPVVLTRSEVHRLLGALSGTSLQRHILKVAQLREEDCANSAYCGVWLPDALARKYPGASLSLQWHNLFPSSVLSVEPRSSHLCRHHVDESGLNKFIRRAAAQCGNNWGIRM